MNWTNEVDEYTIAHGKPYSLPEGWIAFHTHKDSKLALRTGNTGQMVVDFYMLKRFVDYRN